MINGQGMIPKVIRIIFQVFIASKFVFETLEKDTYCSGYLLITAQTVWMTFLCHAISVTWKQSM